jgi:diadenosine tetraphosphate (Ap4A) HIT family hydrolase
MANEVAVALPDAHPLADGHTLVVPRKHVGSVYELSVTDQAAIWKLVGEVREQLLAKYQPDAFNIGVNDGFAAGQTVSHAHIHIIPRRHGDVPDPRGGIRWILAENAAYWRKQD